MATITAANSVFSISIYPIYPTAITLEGYGVDDAFGSEAIEKSIMRIGVDGKPSVAYVIRPIPVPVTLQSNSPSVNIFNTWAQRMDGIKDALVCNASLIHPSLNRRYVMTIGALTGYVPIPQTTEYINDIPFTITFSQITIENI